MTEHKERSSPACRLGRIEYDGSRYCYEHFGFAYSGGNPWCDESSAEKRKHHGHTNLRS
jgi:hypothetical protein